VANFKLFGVEEEFFEKNQKNHGDSPELNPDFTIYIDRNDYSID
jgi:hypothetical protein